jgi:hypothetical protein
MSYHSSLMSLSAGVVYVHDDLGVVAVNPARG